MEKATLAYLRHLFFWTEANKQGLNPAHPDIREVEGALAKDFMNKFRDTKIADIN